MSNFPNDTTRVPWRVHLDTSGVKFDKIECRLDNTTGRPSDCFPFKIVWPHKNSARWQHIHTTFLKKILKGYINLKLGYYLRQENVKLSVLFETYWSFKSFFQDASSRHFHIWILTNPYIQAFVECSWEHMPTIFVSASKMVCDLYLFWNRQFRCIARRWFSHLHSFFF